MKKAREGKIQPLEVLLMRAMPPRFGVMEKLEEVTREWGSVVGSILGKQSAPLDIANETLVVAAENPLAGNRLTMMGGNIARALTERWGLRVVKVKVVVGALPLKGMPRKPGAAGAQTAAARPATVRVREEDVREFESRCLENQPELPQSAVESLARLRAFFIKRFNRGN